MCTCVTYHTADHYFGRNLDLEFSYQESVTVTPRNFPIPFRKNETMKTHHAIIGMAFVCENFPLYYDATNEFGLSMAGLNFPGNGYFPQPLDDDKDEVAPF
jgi:choloylglycine hydrolase